jgi:protein-L-isoaspartate(D-aspartate) O-methyltransferase
MGIEAEGRTMVDAALQRLNMVDSQVLPSDVTDHRILRAMRELPREKFVPPALSPLAYMDEAVPVSPAGSARRWLLAPRVAAKLLQLADVGEHDHVLDIGCATGYSAALLSRLARSVIAMECDETLVATARSNLADLGMSNVSVLQGSLILGCANKAPYDVIVLQGSIDVPLDDLLDQLKDGGRLVAIVNEGGLGRATIWKRFGRSMDDRVAFDASAPELPGFQKAPAFLL